MINAIIYGLPFSAYFRQITDTLLAVAGGYLNKINNTFYLTGGNKFMGRYNPMGPNHGPGFVQIYTNSIRRFNIIDDGTTLVVHHFTEIYDPINLHRRDYNVVPQIMPNGEEGLTAFSGVFQLDANLPFLNSVNIDSSGYFVNNDFSQYYNHYHCAHIPLYSAAQKEMHTVFFGGIAQYYDDKGTLVQDNNVPFVKTIARVTRNANGMMAEYKLPVEMPAFLGAGSEFIPMEHLPKYHNGVLKLDDFERDTTLVGYIYGGIASSAPNIFFTNTGAESSASSQIFKVYIVKNAISNTHELNIQSIGTLQLQVYPNPSKDGFTVKFNLKSPSTAKLTLYDSNGNWIESTILSNLKVGENIYSKQIEGIKKRGIYFISLETESEKASQKIVIH